MNRLLPKQPTIALFIDADNVPASSLVFTLEKLSQYGVVTHRNAYGNWTKNELQPWAFTGQQNAINFVQIFDICTHKNASDIAMVVDILDWVNHHPTQTIAIMSSDADFTPLIKWLNRRNKITILIGEHKTAQHLKECVMNFIEIPTKTNVTPQLIITDTTLDILLKVMTELAPIGSFVQMGLLGGNLRGKLEYTKGGLTKLIQFYPHIFTISNNQIKLKKLNQTL